MNSFKRKTAISLLCLAVLALGGCATTTPDTSVATTGASTQTVVTTAVTIATTPNPEDVVTAPAKANEKQAVDGYEISVGNPYEVTNTSGSPERIIVFDISMKNGSNEACFASASGNFRVTVDGATDSQNYLRTFAMKLAAQSTGDKVFGSFETELGTGYINAGDTGTGILPLVLPADFEKVVIEFLPKGVQSLNVLVYEFTADQVAK